MDYTTVHDRTIVSRKGTGSLSSKTIRLVRPKTSTILTSTSTWVYPKRTSDTGSECPSTSPPLRSVITLFWGK